MRITVAVVAILALVAVSWADNPGIKARITNHGLDLVLQSAINSAIRKIKTNPITLSTDARGRFYWNPPYDLIKPKLANVNFGSASLRSFRNSSLRLTMRRATVGISLIVAGGGAKHGDVDRLVAKNIHFTMTLYIRGRNGKPQVIAPRSYEKCDIKYRMVITLNHLASARGVPMMRKLRGEGCKLIREFIGGTLNGEIRKATSPATIWKGTTDYYLPKTGKRKSVKIELMYKIAKTTSYRNNYVDVYLTGDVYQDEKKTAKQFTPAAFPANAPVNKMLYFWLSEAVFNNIFNVAHGVQIFKTKRGQTEIKTAAAPKASFKKSGVSFRVTCDILITYPILGTTSTKSGSMEVNIDVTLKLKGKTITTAVKSKSSKFNDITGFESATPQMEAVAVKFVTEKLSPIKLPLPKYLKLLNGVITPNDGFIMIGADAEIRM